MGYKCSYCGAEYDHAIDRARCEFICDEKAKMAAEEERKRRLESERERRYEELLAAEKRYEDLLHSYYMDYGTIGLLDEAQKTVDFMIF